MVWWVTKHIDSLFAHKLCCLHPSSRAHPTRAREAHRKKQWTEVQQWCTRVIDIADDWNALEQAHLRLALAEQKRAGADGGRRAFQVPDKCRMVYACAC